MSAFGQAAGQADEAAERDELRATVVRLQRQLTRARAKVDDLVDATIHAAKDATLAQGPIPLVPAPAKDRRRAKPEHALWDTGDWQGAKVTTSYNSQVMRTRVLEFCDRAIRVTRIQRADHPVPDCTILFGGDMVEGLFNFPTQPFEIDATLFEQYVRVSRLLVEVVQRALAEYRHVTVIAEWGNHGRIGSKRSTVPRSDNFDRMCYELARQLLAGDPRLTWEDCPEDVQHFTIGAYRALNLHGDEIGRNGYAAPQTIVNHVNRWRSGGFALPFQDAYVHHYHTPMEFTLADGFGQVYFTGSTESDNRYASVGLASAGRPSGRVHFIDPVGGVVTAKYSPIWLDR